MREARGQLASQAELRQIHVGGAALESGGIGAEGGHSLPTGPNLPSTQEKSSNHATPAPFFPAKPGGGRHAPIDSNRHAHFLHKDTLNSQNCRQVTPLSPDFFTAACQWAGHSRCFMFFHAASAWFGLHLHV